MNYRIILLLTFCALCCMDGIAQKASAPDEAVVIGIPPEERIDINGDGIADLVITGIVDRTPDPEQGLDGWYRRYVQALPGTSVLMRTTHNNSGYYTLPEGASIDTSALSKGFHYKQLMWSDPERPVHFPMLQQPFGPGIAPAASGWYGTGVHFDGTMILRTRNGDRTRINAFDLWFTLPAGRIGVVAHRTMLVPFDFGKSGDRTPTLPAEDDPYSFGHERTTHLIMPTGIPPDEAIDLTSDDIPDVVLTGDVIHNDARTPGRYRRGIRALPGTQLLLVKRPDGSYGHFQLSTGTPLTPDRLAADLHSGVLRWTDPERGSELLVVLQRSFEGSGSHGWTMTDEPIADPIVFRSEQYGRPMIGCFEVRTTTPGGELWLDLRGLVDEGEVLLSE